MAEDTAQVGPTAMLDVTCCVFISWLDFGQFAPYLWCGTPSKD